MQLPWLFIVVFALDAALGEPPNRWHPVAWFGTAAGAVERWWRRMAGDGVLAGGMAWLTLVAPCAAGAWALVWLPQRWRLGGVAFATACVLAYFTVAMRSLWEHSRRIRTALEAGDLAKAREALSMIVSRETAGLGESEIVRGGVESLGENLIDAVTSAWFWLAVGYWAGGLPLAASAAVTLRAINTLDACWGYRDARYERFGKVAARADDAVHWVSARLTLLAVAVASPLVGGSAWRALATGWRHRREHPSPNSCWGMAGFAGALGIRLGGPTRYPDGVEEYHYWGDGRAELNARDLARAERLAWCADAAFMGMLLLGGALWRMWSF